ncbi:MAG: response regulator [Candidatus Micrarchaeota archaeon]
MQHENPTRIHERYRRMGADDKHNQFADEVGAMAKKTIMVVDDEPDIRESVKAIMGKAGYNVVVAVDGDDCLRKLPAQKVDLILLDIMMPGTPVRDVVPKIKNTKIVYLSVVRVSEAEKEELLGSKNVVGFIQKPFDVPNLISQVKKLVG